MSDSNVSKIIEAVCTEAARHGATPAQIEELSSLVRNQYESSPPLIIEYEKTLSPPISYEWKKYPRDGSLGYNADEVFGK